MIKITNVYGVLCQSLSVKENKKFNIIIGKKDNYTYVIGDSKANNNTFYIKFSVSKDNNKLTDDVIKGLNDISNQIVNISSFSYDLSIYVKKIDSIESQSQLIEQILNKTIEFFKDNSIQNVDELTGEKSDTDVYSLYGSIKLISDSTFNRKISEQPNNKTEESENVLFGIMGALVGSVLGAVSIVAIGQLGFVASISGVIMGFATLAGYKKLGKKMDIKGIIISVIIMVIMTYLASRLNTAIAIVKELPSANLLEIFKNLPNLVKYKLVKPNAYYGNIAMTYLFTAIGAFSSIKKYSQDASQDNSLFKL